MTKEEMDALLEEALACAGGDMERVARAALKGLVDKIKHIDALEKTIAAMPAKRPPGRPSKPGLRGPKTKKNLGAPNKMGLGISTKELGEIAGEIKKRPTYVFDHEPTAEEIASMPPITNVEAATRVLDIFDHLAAYKDKNDVKNIAKHIP